MTEGRAVYYCSFCEIASTDEACLEMIAGPGTVCICGDCVHTCTVVIHEQRVKRNAEQVSAKKESTND